MRVITTACGIAAIGCLTVFAPVVSPSHDPIAHWSGTARNLLVPCWLNFLGAWCVCACLLLLCRRATRLSLALLLAGSIALVVATAKSIASLAGWQLPGLFGRLLAGLVGLLILGCLWRLRSVSAAGLIKLRRTVSDLLSITVLPGGLLLLQLAWFSWQARHLDPHTTPGDAMLPLASATQQGPGTAQRGRILWIVLDELSYKQVYERRFKGLALPAFDQWAAEASVLTKVVPAGIRTGDVLPSLLTGLEVDRTRATPDGDTLLLHDLTTQQWSAFKQDDTVFHDAAGAGFRTAIAGWYIPYCRILRTVLDRCFWTFDESLANGMSSDASIARNTLRPWLWRFPKLRHLLPAGDVDSLNEDLPTEEHLADYRSLLKASDTVLGDPRLTFALLHMPIPHPLGIYKRATGQMAKRGSSYVDNLALADAYLAHVRSTLEASGEWNSATVVVMGDHSWRTQLLWLAEPHWTAEDQEASRGGEFDDRPVYLVKLPGQRQAAKIDVPFAARDTRLLFDEIFSGRMTSPEALVRWIESRRSDLGR